MYTIIQIEKEENIKRIRHKIKKYKGDEYLPSRDEVAAVKEVKELLGELLHLQRPQYHWKYKYGGYFRDISHNKPTELTIYDTGRKIKLTILVEYRHLVAIRTETGETALMNKEERRQNETGWEPFCIGMWRSKKRKLKEEQDRREAEARLAKEREKKEMEERWEESMRSFREGRNPGPLGFKGEQERKRMKEKELQGQEYWIRKEREEAYWLCMGYSC